MNVTLIAILFLLILFLLTFGLLWGWMPWVSALGLVVADWILAVGMLYFWIRKDHAVLRCIPSKIKTDHSDHSQMAA
jgi:hypothetical protein